MVGGPPSRSAIKRKVGAGALSTRFTATIVSPPTFLTLIQSKRAALKQQEAPPPCRHCTTIDFDFVAGLHCYHFTDTHIINTGESPMFGVGN
jgi:hypothetical protein